MLSSFTMLTGKNIIHGIYEDKNEEIDCAPIIGISRCRIKTDGEGITTLVGFGGCPLHCRYCANPQCHDIAKCVRVSSRKLYEILLVDDLYFRATGGGVMFGGGEPGLYPDFISEFRSICGNKWKIGIETSLNFPLANLQKLISVIDEYIIDIKDLDPKIYFYYTGCTIKKLIANLKYLAKNIDVTKVTIRVPFIPQYNTINNINHSLEELRELDFVRFETLEYNTHIIKKISKTTDTEQPNYGKAVCELLKLIRKEVTEANNIEFNLSACPNKVCATGYCPKCDQEAMQIMSIINDICANGIKVNL